MFLDQPGAALWVLTGTPWFRLNKHFDRPGGRHPKQAEAQEAAKLVHTRIAHAATTPGYWYSKPNLVAGSRAVNTLQHELKTEGRLERTTTIGGSSPRRATRSQPHTSPLTVKPSRSR